MAIWTSWFREKSYPLPSLQTGMFGRYTDSYKSEYQRQCWSEAVKAFEQGRFLDEFEALMGYFSDPKQASVTWKREGERLLFEISQGSRLITGQADAYLVRAEAAIAQTTALPLDLSRRLMEQNYRFEYCRYAIDPQGKLALVFSSFAADCAPYKCYQALKELALHADKQDDLLLQEFPSLQALHNNPIVAWSEAHCEARYTYLQDQIAQLVSNIQQSGLDVQQNEGAISYMILATLYRLDYLVKSEGQLMEQIEQLRSYYFDKSSEESQNKKNEVLLGRLMLLTERPYEDFKKELYQVQHTFGLTVAESHDRFVGFVDGELRHMDWYLAKGYEAVAQAVPDYIVGHCLFNYALPQPLCHLLHLYYEIMEQPLFLKLGFDYAQYQTEKGFDEAKIRNSISDILEMYQPAFPRLSTDKMQLPFKKGKAALAAAYLLFLRQLDFSKP